MAAKEEALAALKLLGDDGSRAAAVWMLMVMIRYEDE